VQKAMNQISLKNILSQLTPYSDIPFLDSLDALIFIQYQFIIFF